MRAVFAATICALAVACAREGHVLESEAAERPPVSVADLERMCAEAFIPLPGARPGMTPDQVHVLLVAQHGQSVADALKTSVAGRSAVARRDELFLHTTALCNAANLPPRCQSACEETQSIEPSP